MQPIAINLCEACTFLTYKPYVPDSGPATCHAFPDGIPDSIYIHGGDHREAVEGDSGIVFNLMEGYEDNLQSWVIQEAGS